MTPDPNPVIAFLNELGRAMRDERRLSREHSEALEALEALDRVTAERDQLREHVNAQAAQPIRWKQARRRTFRRKEAS